MIKHDGPIAGIASHGNYVATAGYDNKIILWDALTRKSIYEVSHDHLVNNCSFSPDGKFLVSASSDYTARVWEVPSLKLLAVLSGHEDDVDMAVFSPDGKRIATCALDRCVRIYDIKGKCIHTMQGHTGNVLSLAWTKDGHFIVSSSVDGTLRKWDASTGVVADITQVEIRTDTVEIDSNGTIYAGDDYGRIVIVEDGGIEYTQAHSAGIKKIVLCEKQQTILTLSYDRAICIWKINPDKSLALISRSEIPSIVWARAAAILENGAIAAGTFGTTYAIFSPATQRWDITGISAGPAINSIHSDSEHIYAIGDAGAVIVDGEISTSLGSLCNFIVTLDRFSYAGGQLGQLFNAQNGKFYTNITHL